MTSMAAGFFLFINITQVISYKVLFQKISSSMAPALLCTFCLSRKTINSHLLLNINIFSQSQLMQKYQTYYDILKVTRDAPTAVIQAAFKALMQLNHPDNFTGREDESVSIAIQLREACDVLINPETRTQYDRWLDKEHGSADAASDCDSQSSVTTAHRKAA